MSPIETERKLRQLDNDVQSIYEMLSAISGTQARHGNRLLEQAEKLDGVAATLGGLEGRFDGLEGRMGGLEAGFESVQSKLDSVLEILRSR